MTKHHTALVYGRIFARAGYGKRSLSLGAGK